MESERTVLNNLNLKSEYFCEIYEKSLKNVKKSYATISVALFPEISNVLPLHYWSNFWRDEKSRVAGSTGNNYFETWAQLSGSGNEFMTTPFSSRGQLKTCLFLLVRWHFRLNFPWGFVQPCATWSYFTTSNAEDDEKLARHILAVL